MLHLPQNVLKIFQILDNQEVYLIGGCVRDLLLHKTPLDYDFTTILHPQELLKILHQHKIPTIDIGLKYGTLGILLEKQIYEITTFRKEGKYQNFRKPSYIEFASSLQEDILRRDFSINAIAYHPKKGLIDYHNGIKDLQTKTLRTINKAKDRFLEDSLRILRGIGFVARFNLQAEQSTKQAMHTYAHHLHQLPKERIHKEWLKIIEAPFYQPALIEFQEIFNTLFDGNFNFSVLTKQSLPQNPLYKTAILLNDEKQLNKLNFNNKQQKSIKNLFQWYRSDPFKDKKAIKKILSYKSLQDVAIFLQEDSRYQWLETILTNKEPFLLKDLKINGKDLANFQGPTKGKILHDLLDLVINEKVPNTKQALLEKIKTLPI